jgi:hypothetical protein
MKHGLEVAYRRGAAIFRRDAWIIGASLLSCQAWIGVDDYTFEATDGGAVGRNQLNPGAGGAGVPSAGSGGADARGGAATAGGTATVGAGGASAATGGTSGCDGASADDCAATTFALHGTVTRFESGEPLAGVGIAAAGLGSVLETTTASDGSFVLGGVPPADFVELTLTNSAAATEVPAFRRTQLRIEDPSSAALREVRLPSVDHGWRVQIAKDCGAIAPDASATTIDAYFNQRSTLVVDAGPDALGTRREQVRVRMTRTEPGNVMTEWQNSDPSPSDSDPNPTRVCFLDTGPAGEVRGSSAEAATELGQFVMFRVRNFEGTGDGVAEVELPGGGNASIRFTGAGQTALVRIGSAW